MVVGQTPTPIIPSQILAQMQAHATQAQVNAATSGATLTHGATAAPNSYFMMQHAQAQAIQQMQAQAYFHHYYAYMQHVMQAQQQQAALAVAAAAQQRAGAGGSAGGAFTMPPPGTVPGAAAAPGQQPPPGFLGGAPLQGMPTAGTMPAASTSFPVGVPGAPGMHPGYQQLTGMMPQMAMQSPQVPGQQGPQVSRAPPQAPHQQSMVPPNGASNVALNQQLQQGSLGPSGSLPVNRERRPSASVRVPLNGHVMTSTLSPPANNQQLQMNLPGTAPQSTPNSQQQQTPLPTRRSLFGPSPQNGVNGPPQPPLPIPLPGIGIGGPQQPPLPMPFAGPQQSPMDGSAPSQQQPPFPPSRQRNSSRGGMSEGSNGSRSASRGESVLLIC